MIIIKVKVSLYTLDITWNHNTEFGVSRLFTMVR